MHRLRALAILAALVLAGQAAVSGARTYTVRRGDTLSRVSKQTGVPVPQLAEANGLKNPNFVREGQVLSIPGGGQPRPPTPAPLPPLPSPVVVVGGEHMHNVVRGDTLAAIARRYGTTVTAIATANAIRNANRIRAGVALKVPSLPWLCPVNGPRSFVNDWGVARPGNRRHMGNDVFAARGTPVVASVSGRVEHSQGSVAGLAYYLHGDDGNVYYGSHLDALHAQQGRVSRGAVIGVVGTTGNAKHTSPHLHFELKPGGGPSVNPFYSLKRWC